MEEKLVAQAKAAAIAQRRPMNELIEDALRNFLAGSGEKIAGLMVKEVEGSYKAEIDARGGPWDTDLSRLVTEEPKLGVEVLRNRRSPVVLRQAVDALDALRQDRAQR